MKWQQSCFYSRSNDEETFLRKGIIKGIILAAVFVLAVFGFSRMMNRTNEDLTREMAEATLPLVTLSDGENPLNTMRGYTTEMDIRYMRDAITPIPENHEIPMEIKVGAHSVEGISYQIRSLDGELLLADSEITGFTADRGRIATVIPIQGIIDKDVEYALIINVTDGGGTYHYYTRIMESDRCYTGECLDFVKEFHEKALNPETYESLATYLEPDSSGDNSTLQRVTINSSLKQVGYANFGGQEIEPPVPKIMEINPSYHVILMDYVITRVGDHGVTEYYNCEEYFRVRHTSDRDYLLNYERTMNEIYRGEDAHFYGSYLQLGITDPEVPFMANEPSTAVAFVQEGELWCYTISNARLYQVFSFRGPEGIDERENFGEHGIKIISIDEEGSVNFAVYGYMNRGEHEGECGIGVYHFNGVTNTVEEEIFIPMNRSYEVLASDIGSLMYENEKGQFTLMLDGAVYKIDLDTRRVTTMMTSLTEGTYAVSESNRYLAYQSEGEMYSAKKLTICDFESDSTYDIEAEPGEFLKPLGFMQEDCIYGVARASDVLMDKAGNVTFPMYKVCIMSTDSGHELLKEYSKPGYFVSDIYIDDYTIYLNRIEYNGIAYVEAEQDTIMNREGNSMETITLHSTVTEIKETEMQIDLGTEVKTMTAKMLTPKEIVNEEDRLVRITLTDETERFYVYAKGKVQLSTYLLKDAVGRANDDMGVVIGDDCEYLWKRARASAKSAIPIDEEAIAENTTSISKCISAMLNIEGISIDVESMLNSGKTPKEILQSSLRDVRFLDLSGCDVDETLYYISCGSPVFALAGADDAVLLVGYDANNVTIYRSMTSEKVSMPLEEATNFFADNGNVFFSYVE